MRRVKQVSAAREGVKARVTIEVVGKRGWLTRDETDRLTHALASDTMRTLAGAQYLHVPLSEIEVK